LSLSCSDDGDDEQPAPLGAVAIDIGKLLPRGGDTWKPGAAEPVVLGCDRKLGVVVTVWDPDAKRRSERLLPSDPVDPPDIDAPDYQNGNWSGDWLFRPPGACTRKQCGTLHVSVAQAGGTEATAEVALDTAVVDVSSLETGFAGALRIRAELREDGGDTVGVYGQEPLVAELTLDVVSADCTGDGEGGAGGAPATGGTGGSGNQGGEAGGPAAAGGAGGAASAPGGGAGEASL
jgi:hypothetical protein